MANLTIRQNEILLAVIGEHIRKGEPVSSMDIRERYRIAYSPATIRNEMFSLTEAGYLLQPHTSAGRIPTDSGYRWYVNMLEERRSTREPKQEKQEKGLMEILDGCNGADDFFRVSTGLLSEITNGLAIGGAISNEGEPLYKSGFANIFGEEEFFESESRNHFGVLLDSIDSEMRQLVRTYDLMSPQVFIGDENPIRNARPYSMILRQISHDGTIGVIAIIGPKRMRYEKALNLLRALDKSHNIYEE